MITSTQNDRVKLVRALQEKARTRRKEGKIVLEGARLVRDALARGMQPDFVFYTDEALKPLEVFALAVTPDVMRYMSDTEQPQGIIGVFPLPKRDLPTKPARVLVLDGLRDPGNMGTILRTAAGAGVEAVLLSPDCVDLYNPKVLRGGMGAHFRLPIVTLDWTQIGDYCRALNIYLADSTGDGRYDQVDWSQPHALIIGSEAHGASSDAIKLAAQRVYIPMTNDTESINAAVAAGVMLFEAQRQCR
jgi:TrmH family RNA methyltransferase